MIFLNEKIESPKKNERNAKTFKKKHCKPPFATQRYTLLCIENTGIAVPLES